jgi:hypothetical protein
MCLCCAAVRAASWQHAGERYLTVSQDSTNQIGAIAQDVARLSPDD